MEANAHLHTEILPPLARKLVEAERMRREEKVVSLEERRQRRENTRTAYMSPEEVDELLGSFPDAFTAYMEVFNNAMAFGGGLHKAPELSDFSAKVEALEASCEPGFSETSAISIDWFYNYLLFDFTHGAAMESLGSIMVTLFETFDADPVFLMILKKLAGSRMGLYVHEGRHNERVILRELVTGVRCEAITPVGPMGAPGELWYTRVLEPLLPRSDAKVVFTMPYLCEAEEVAWCNYLDSILPEGQNERVKAYETFMKQGPEPQFWPEFIKQNYNRRGDLLASLRGVPLM